MDRRAEVQRLNAADHHIGTAERLIAEQRLRIAYLGADNPVGTDAERLLRTMQQTLTVLREHRQLIVATIEQIDAGLA
ncbi:hypothetical protein Q8W71_29570 [Methylobacterium sp. NEAU 140]|uniref:hypothetical protein n=1 Tax=Methylobacterium sp. NEAU 140 TaxID=3064945 RepID=UPI0027371D75|nr:hypothetical protein [Methylobacterium sp. NEAU 140]MDP4026759.1 hypothetical protein [Methylobacterium sp. NEAU 140]